MYLNHRNQRAGASHRSFGDNAMAHRTLADLSSAEESGLLASARKGSQSAVGQIFDRHGTAVLALACAILRNGEQAETVVIDVIARACTGTGDAHPAASLRHNLARATYLRCVPTSSDPVGDSSSRSENDEVEHEGLDGAAALMTSLGRLARQQRTAIALVMVGDHTYLEVARLLRVPPQTVIGLLVSSMRDLQLWATDDESASASAPSARRHHSSWAGSRCR